jgi:hypothetical protein
MPDPVSQELCRYRNRIEHLEKRLDKIAKLDKIDNEDKKI